MVTYREGGTHTSENHTWSQRTAVWDHSLLSPWLGFRVFNSGLQAGSANTFLYSVSPLAGPFVTESLGRRVCLHFLTNILGYHKTCNENFTQMPNLTSSKRKQTNENQQKYTHVFRHKGRDKRGRHTPTQSTLSPSLRVIGVKGLLKSVAGARSHLVHTYREKTKHNCQRPEGTSNMCACSGGSTKFELVIDLR